MFRKMICAVAALTMTTIPAQAQETAETEVAAAADARLAINRPLDPVINPDMTVDRENIWLLDLSNGGRVAIRLKPDWAPGHVERIKALTLRGFYNGTPFHRVIDGFMAQTGDPTGTGTGGSELPDIAEEFHRMPHVRGSVSMARSASPDSANSQFFLVFYPRFNLDENYTNFGRVIANMAAVDAIERGEPPANPTRILQASIAADNKPVPAMPAPSVPDAEISVSDLNAPIGN